MKANIPVTSLLALVATTFFFSAPDTGVDASPYVISDDRVRNLDITPTLGRGYSVMTDSYQSTCLMVEETTVPSYNYDYTFYDFTRTTDFESEMSYKLSYTFGYWWFWSYYFSRTGGGVEYESGSTTQVETNTRYIVGVMRIERYYASVREELSPMNADAQELLNRQDYVGFFKACGPNYIRGIRRAQEVTAVFSFESANADYASEFSYNLQVSSGWWWYGRSNYESTYAYKTKYNSITNTLKITILGYGLGLNQEGSETLVATSLTDYSKVMEFAFNTMTKNEDSVHIGMVYGMEVVPWAENVQFQLQSGIQDNSIEIPLPRSLIPRAYRRSNPSDAEFDKTQREDFKCKEPAYEIDKYGYCCESDNLYSYEDEAYIPIDPETKVCRPLRVLDRAIITENMAANGEFVARMDRAVRFKVNQLNTMEKCISATRAIPERFDYNILKPQDTVFYDESIDFKFTVYELKIALDPFDDYSFVKHMAQELDEFMNMFYSPCISALFGTNVGLSAETDPSYFMAYPWHTHKECSYLSCLGSSMRWNREEGGGCVPSLISGVYSKEYSTSDDKNCKKSTDTSNYHETCEYLSNDLVQYHFNTITQWNATLPLGRIDYFMDHFCLPQITHEVLKDGIYTTNKAQTLASSRRRLTSETNGRAGVESVNVARGKPTFQPTTILGGSSSRAVDGNTNKRYRFKSITHTQKMENPYWHVDLEDKFTIQKVNVFNRQDCCADRLRDFKMTIYRDGVPRFTYNHSGTPGHKTEIVVDPVVVGDKVQVEINRDDYLSLAEVEVWNLF